MRLPWLPVALLAAAPLHAQAAPQDLCTGHWDGRITLPNAALDFDVDFVRSANGDCTGDLSIPAQQARDVKLSNVRVRGDSVHFEMGGVAGTPTFNGAAVADRRTISGAFTQATLKVSFSMTRGASPAERARKALEGFDAWVDSARTAWKVAGLSVGIVVNGEVVYLKGHGYRDVEKKLPVTPNTLFAIGSSSKAFTTFAMASLVEQGKLAWDVPLRTYLPWFKLTDEAVAQRLTPRDLVTHRSGMPRHDALWYNNNWATREELVRRLAYLPLNADLREKFQYNNLMFLTAGYLVGSLTGKTWEEGVSQLVLTPLGMSRTNFSVAQSKADADHAEPYEVRKDTIAHIPFRDITLVGPAGSINSSAADMTRWVTMHLAGGKLEGKQIVRADLVKDMYRPYTPIGGITANPELGPQSYGLGWFVDTYRGHYRAEHGGNIDGFTASVTLLPNDNIGIVVLANQNGAALPQLLSRHAMDRLFGGDRKDWSGLALAASKASAAANLAGAATADSLRTLGTTPQHKLAEYVGAYADSGYGALRVTMERDTLVLTYNNITAKLQHWHYETFRALRNPADPALEGMTVTFRTDARGRVDGAVLPIEPAVKPVAFGRQPDARLRDAAFLQTLVGRYKSALGEITITLAGTTLTATQSTGASTVLDPGLGLEFQSRANTSVSMQFVVDAAGKVTALRSIQPGVVMTWARVP